MTAGKLLVTSSLAPVSNFKCSRSNNPATSQQSSNTTQAQSPVNLGMMPRCLYEIHSAQSDKQVESSVLHARRLDAKS